MDKYIPTTQEIREAFSKQAIPYAKDPHIPIVNEWFDRWLFHIQEDAWDSGYQAGLLDYASSMANNPYRQGETE